MQRVWCEKLKGHRTLKSGVVMESERFAAPGSRAPSAKIFSTFAVLLVCARVRKGGDWGKQGLMGSLRISSSMLLS